VKIVKSKNFKKSVSQCNHRGYALDKLKEVIYLLSEEKELESKYRNHKLKGRFGELMECHIEPNWLLLYKIDSNVLYLIDTGTHSDLF
jgi:mRNA interferase YafQ